MVFIILAELGNQQSVFKYFYHFSQIPYTLAVIPYYSYPLTLALPVLDNH